MAFWPENNQVVEVCIDGQWHKARFVFPDSVSSEDPDIDEVWWQEYFRLEDGDSFPEDIREGISEMPRWRPI